MFNIDPAKFLVISAIALMVIGPEKLPRLAHQLGMAMKTLSGYREQAQEEFHKIVPDLGLPHIPTNPSAAVSGFVSGLIRSPSDSPKPINAAQESASELQVDQTGSAIGQRDHVAEKLGYAWENSTADPGMN